MLSELQLVPCTTTTLTNISKCMMTIFNLEVRISCFQASVMCVRLTVPIPACAPSSPMPLPQRSSCRSVELMCNAAPKAYAASWGTKATLQTLPQPLLLQLRCCSAPPSSSRGCCWPARLRPEPSQHEPSSADAAIEASKACRNTHSQRSLGTFDSNWVAFKSEALQRCVQLKHFCQGLSKGTGTVQYPSITHKPCSTHHANRERGARNPSISTSQHKLRLVKDVLTRSESAMA